jgi:hypothetical protein
MHLLLLAPCRVPTVRILVAVTDISAIFCWQLDEVDAQLLTDYYTRIGQRMDIESTVGSGHRLQAALPRLWHAKSSVNVFVDADPAVCFEVRDRLP